MILFFSVTQARSTKQTPQSSDRHFVYKKLWRVICALWNIKRPYNIWAKRYEEYALFLSLRPLSPLRCSLPYDVKPVNWLCTFFINIKVSPRFQGFVPLNKVTSIILRRTIGSLFFTSISANRISFSVIWITAQATIFDFYVARMGPSGLMIR